MAELTLEPYAVLQNWRFPVPPAWDVVLAEYLGLLAQRCRQESGHFLGHIKALALYGDSGYLRLSVVDPQRAAGLEGAAPQGLREMDVTLNVIVYGLSHDFIEQAVAQCAAETAARWNGEVILKEIHHH